MKRCLISVNCLNYIEAIAYASHMQFMYRLGMWVGKNIEEDWQFFFYTPRRMPIATARNEAVKQALQLECDYIFFYDDDMSLRPDVFKKLLEDDKDIVGALAYVRSYPFSPMAFKWIGNKEMDMLLGDLHTSGKGVTLMTREELFSNTDEKGLIEVAALGTPCTLIKTGFLKNMEFPYFWTGLSNTEDVYFCIKAKKYNPDLQMYIDTTIDTGHNLDPEIVDESSRESLFNYYKKINEPVNRGQDYERQIEEKIEELKCS